MKLGLILTLSSCALAAPKLDKYSHKAPAENIAARCAADERSRTLAEMWQRGILSAEMNQWSPQDLALLARVRKAEASGALDFLRRRSLFNKDFSIKLQEPGVKPARRRLTLAGFNAYLQLRSQEALRYFETKGVEARWVYGLTDPEGRPLFDRGSGLLTDIGDELYRRAENNLPAFWKTAAGELMGNRRPR